VIVGEDVRVGLDGSLALFLRAERPQQDYPACGDDLREAIHRSEFYERIDRYFRRAARTDSRFQAAVPGNAYVVSTGASAIALSAATAKTVMYINSAAANQPSIVEFSIGFDGVTASAVPALVELVYGTKATNSSPGTASTTFTPLQIRGWPVQTSAQAAANNCTSEPTVLTSIKQWLVSPNGGLIVIQSPLGREPTGVASGTAVSGNQVGFRVTAPAVVNSRGYVEIEE
jgi:hypothetical protein